MYRCTKYPNKSAAPSVLAPALVLVLVLIPVRPLAQVNDKLVLSKQFATYPVRESDTDTVSMIFIGDVMMHSAQIENTKRNDGTFCFDGYFDDIAGRLESADIAVANMEFTLGGPPYTGYPSFSAPDAYAEYMAACGIDIFLTANNHILDKGSAGLKRTLSVYRRLADSLGIMYTGSSEHPDSADRVNPLMFSIKGLKIALVNFTYGTNVGSENRYPGPLRMNREDVGKAIGKAKKCGCDFIIALPHWGEEYKLRHSPAQERFAGWMASEGADLIIGTHPHVIQDMDTITAGDRTVPVIYSLGNAVSNMSASDTQAELMVEIKIARDRQGRIRFTDDIDFTYLWCCLPGRLRKSHSTTIIEDHIRTGGKKMTAHEYEKMVKTYYRVQEKTGIKNSINGK